MYEKRIKLSQRLITIAGFIEKGARVADIGTGDGHLPVYLAQNELASHIIASDKSASSVETALRSAEKYGVEDKISFIVAPGLTGIDKAEVDTIVIAGMGGETISAILSDAPWIRTPGIRLILQPQSKTDKLCYWLNTNGFTIYESALVRDRGRLYTILLARAERGLKNDDNS